ncbi:YidC/Oxa1 family membrane protein insertase [Curtanaerobium respiraculi]|uniref:YidC/Oxa1 family membrane protein insertase n=1 Tax=Curtanaerobium respiraculi TaxID=2949669 RepID=UPI0024B37866|nr:YidC/Oxa1 family membrane protein insertase [Curtanaerobium respiraculi]
MWDAFKDFIFACINGVYGIFGDWGMAILLVTLIFRLILFPLMQKQIKSSYQMQKVQPLIQEIQAKYADEPIRQQEEVQKIYAEAKFNPIAGCLPLFLQMPIFVALFQVLQEMASRTTGSSYQFYHLVPDLTLTPGSSFAVGIGAFIPYLILLVVFAGATFLPMVLQQMNTPNSPQRKQTLIISAFMTVFMVWIGWSSPGGVLLFWGVSSLFGVCQQQLTTRALKKKDAEEEAKIVDKPVKVDVTRKAKKKRPSKKR